MASKDLQDVIELLASRDRPDNPTIEDSRTGFEQLAQQIGGNTEADVTSVDADGVPAEWVAAHNASDDSAILYLHGGGYAIGSVETHRELAARISQSTGSRVLTIDYRMAPENPFPAAVEDATNAYRWLLGQGVNPRQM
ncbi:MAG: alpha/beta hydrolase fold domain-containing protein, partial [SAR202 cluster bacterium]|nr:alpha/beta hydrolase fold domain-containing protein [SAR202 cluster bacterium]